MIGTRRRRWRCRNARGAPDQGVHDRLELAQPGRVGEDDAPECLAVDGTILHDARKSLVDRRHGGTAACQQAMNGGVGIMHRHTHAPQHGRTGRFSHADRPGQADDDHRTGLAA